jgi:hypothetical protein
LEDRRNPGIEAIACLHKVDGFESMKVLILHEAVFFPDE